MVSTVFSIASEPVGATSTERPLAGRPLGDFVAGPENVVLLLAADSLGRRQHYNPLLLYGPTGVGKTHLLHVLAAQFAQRQDVQAVVYNTATDYRRTLCSAEELDAITELRQKYRDADLLALDDLQDFASHKGAQQEFLHTLDARLDAGRPVLVASRASPAELVQLLPGLQSRLTAGLALPVAEPGTQARKAIVTRLKDRHGLKITDEAEQLLVSPARSIPRRLRTVGQLNSALLELTHSREQPITAAAVRRLLRSPTPGTELTLGQITRHTARHFQVRSTDLKGGSRRQSTVRARGVAIYLARLLMGTSFEELGTYFGGRDHSTIMHAFRRTEGSMRLDPLVQSAVADIVKQLGTSMP